ncbi:hypothetical protein [Helicobacter turcicus]|uniref:Uncharacterized protein n=1 Tax=Helicobacter turcicus TaxID=2867412 RepID=A0ABS7JQ94_9HELI|nr:hypothetical protein [Helicobacter turcicus]MBX7491528.1 hypothetical protein [Helicobacter turcicus]MBX7546384.1 hypothetical protein [Helicobacter turcicus]
MNWHRANVSWHQGFASSRSEQKEMLENVLEVLKSETATQRGSYMGQTENPEHFEKRKNSAIDIL